MIPRFQKKPPGKTKEAQRIIMEIARNFNRWKKFLSSGPRKGISS